MRYPTGCENCRERHVKCEIPEGAERCRRCEERNESCNRRSSLRFREVTSISARTARGRTEKRKIAYEHDHKWTRITGPVNFVEDSEGDGPSPGNSPRHENAFMDGSNMPMQDVLMENAASPQSAHSQSSAVAAEAQAPHQNPQDNKSNFMRSPLATAVETQQMHAMRSGSDFGGSSHSRHSGMSPELPFSLPSGSIETSSWPENRPLPPLYRAETQQPIGSRKEAHLLKHFIENQAPELDVCDLMSHFAREVPQRAMYCPALMNAILAFASRNMSVIAGLDDEDSEHYHSLCLKSLIPALDDPSDVVDENLLVTIVILRLYEERARVEEEYHRLGQTRLLNTMSFFASSGGMAEAASWLSLRQEIRVSFTSKQVLKIRLDNFAGSRAFSDEDEGSWANRIIFITAKVLANVFQEHREISREEWNALDSELDAWNSQRPSSFDPLWTVTPSRTPNHQSTIDSLESSAFPEIIMSQGAHVVGAQYYSMSKLLLATHNPHVPHVGFGAVKQRRDADRMAVGHLRKIVGLAISNKACLNASVTATYALHSCGFWLSEPREQEEAVEYLYHIERLMGWNTGHIIPTLRSHWMVGA